MEDTPAEPTRTPYHERRAEDLRRAAYALGDLLAEKAAAYGNAQDMQRGLWRVLLEPYREPEHGTAGHYLLPEELLDHIPRLTRVFDRICRIVSNPAGDRMGEDPWRDLAGDAVAGIVMPRCCPEPDCQREAGHPGSHGSMDARGVLRWTEAFRPDAPPQETALKVGGDGGWPDGPARLSEELRRNTLGGAGPTACGEVHVEVGTDREWRCNRTEGHEGACKEIRT